MVGLVSTVYVLGRRGGGLDHFPVYRAFVLKYAAILVKKEEGGGLDYFQLHKAFVLKYTFIFVNREERGGGAG